MVGVGDNFNRRILIITSDKTVLEKKKIWVASLAIEIFIPSHW